MKYYNTLDLDKCDAEFLRSVLAKIIKCPNWIFGTGEVRDTQKGYHVIFMCSKVCDDCRLVFDDQKRYAMDFKRPTHKTNILFAPFSVKKLFKIDGKHHLNNKNGEPHVTENEKHFIGGCP